MCVTNVDYALLVAGAPWKEEQEEEEHQEAENDVGRFRPLGAAQATRYTIWPVSVKTHSN